MLARAWPRAFNRVKEQCLVAAMGIAVLLISRQALATSADPEKVLPAHSVLAA
jgi:hypothetical protein